MEGQMKKRESEARERILSASMDLIIERGGAGDVTTRDIAARAGVGIGLVNYHFQTKENLISLCVKRIAGSAADDLAQLAASTEMEPVEKLRLLFKSFARFLAANPGIARVSGGIDLLTPTKLDNTDRLLEACLPAIKEVCAGKATETEMRVLLHLVVSSLQAAFLRGDAFKGFAGFDFANDAQRDQFVDIVIYIVFRKYV
jgi:AcrR family transcriptional regulator